MANYGDNYSYVVSFDTRGAGEPAKATDAVKALDKAVERSGQSAAEASKVYVRARDHLGRWTKEMVEATQATRAQAAAVDDAAEASQAFASASRQTGAGFQNLAGGIMQFTQLAEDAQFGARGLMNNVGGLIATLGGYSPVAMAAAGAGQILVGVFRDQIDSFLAAAGILDENLVKGMERAAAATDAFAEAQGNLLASLPNVTQGIKEQVAQVADLVKQLDGTQARRLMEQAALEETQYRTQDLAQAQRELAAAERERQRVAAAGPAADPNGMRLREAVRQSEEARARMEAIGRDRQQFAQNRVATQAAAAGSSEEGMLRMAERLAALGQRTNNEDLRNLSQAIYRLTDRFAAEEAAREQAEKEAEEVRRLEEELARLTEQENRRREAAERKAQQDAERQAEQAARQAEADAQAAAAPVMQGAGPGVEEAIRAGASPEQAAAELMQQLRALGFTIEEAFGMAARVTEEVNARVQAAMQAERIRAAQMLRGQNPWRNNRPNGL